MVGSRGRQASEVIIVVVRGDDSKVGRASAARPGCSLSSSQRMAGHHTAAARCSFPAPALDNARQRPWCCTTTSTRLAQLISGQRTIGEAGRIVPLRRSPARSGCRRRPRSCQSATGRRCGGRARPSTGGPWTTRRTWPGTPLRARCCAVLRGAARSGPGTARTDRRHRGDGTEAHNTTSDESERSAVREMTAGQREEKGLRLRSRHGGVCPPGVYRGPPGRRAGRVSVLEGASRRWRAGPRRG